MQDWFRAILIILSVIVTVWLFLMTARYFFRLSIGQKLWATGAILNLIYTVDGLREAIQLELGFRWRLIFLTLALVAYFAYLLEPRRKKTQRFGGDPMDDHTNL